jgi:hypothetical protein
MSGYSSRAGFERRRARKAQDRNHVQRIDALTGTNVNHDLGGKGSVWSKFTKVFYFCLPMRRRAFKAGARVGFGFLVFAFAVNLALSGCTHSSSNHAPAAGSALGSKGPAASGVIGFNAQYVHKGREYGFAFPILVNISTSPLSLTGFRLTSVPPGVDVVGYRLLSSRDTNGYAFNSYIGAKRQDDYSKYPDYLPKHPTLAPRSQSSYYGVVIVKVVGRVRRHLSGCAVSYSQRGKAYQQQLRCAFSLSGD